MSQKILQREIGRLEKQLLSLATLAEENVRKAIKAVETRDLALAKEVVKSDNEIDRIEVELEEECLKILALHQPVAIDLREIIVILKINNDLERVGDLATTIAKRAATLADLPRVDQPFDLYSMADKAWSMVHRSLNALVDSNIQLAQQVREEDEEIDKINRRNQKLVRKAICAKPETAEALLCFVWVSRSLERIADHATNIAEDVIYMYGGEIVRHLKNRLPEEILKQAEATAEQHG